MMWFAALSGGLIGLGVFLLIDGLRKRPVPEALIPGVRRRTGRLAEIPRRTWILLGIGLAAGLIVWTISGWAIAIVAGPLAVWGLPTLLSDRARADQITRLEAMEEWTRALAGVLTAGIGLEQALVVSQRSAPPAIVDDVRRLVGRLNARWETDAAIRAFAEDLDDATGDLICQDLLLAARRRGPGLSTILESLAQSVADDVRARRQIEADRAKPRATARWITLISATVLGILAFTGDYVAPYATPIGQVILVILLSVYVAALIWMRKIAAGTPRVRLMGATARRSADRRRHAPEPALAAGGDA